MTSPDEPDRQLQLHLTALGSRLRAARRAADMTQDELAARSGVARGYISQTERGGANISVLMLWRLARALDLHAADLLDDRPRGDR